MPGDDISAAADLDALIRFICYRIFIARLHRPPQLYCSCSTQASIRLVWRYQNIHHITVVSQRPPCKRGIFRGSRIFVYTDSFLTTVLRPPPPAINTEYGKSPIFFGNRHWSVTCWQDRTTRVVLSNMARSNEALSNVARSNEAPSKVMLSKVVPPKSSSTSSSTKAALPKQRQHYQKSSATKKAVPQTKCHKKAPPKKYNLEIRPIQTKKFKLQPVVCPMTPSRYTRCFDCAYIVKPVYPICRTFFRHPQHSSRSSSDTQPAKVVSALATRYAARVRHKPKDSRYPRKHQLG